MRNIKKTELSDRLGTAAGAKAARLQAFQAARKAAEPLREAQQGERIALAEARDLRRALREQAKLEEQARLEAEKRDREAAIAAAARAEADARERAADSRIARVLEDEAQRKAKRDERYASRKARRA